MLFRKTLYGAALLAGAATTLPIQADQEVFSDVIVVNIVPFYTISGAKSSNLVESVSEHVVVNGLTIV